MCRHGGGDDRYHSPQGQADCRRAYLQRQICRWQATFKCSNTGVKTAGNGNADRAANHGGDQSRKGRLNHHRGEHLRSCRSEQAQQGQLTCALRDQNPVGIDDDVGTDEQRHQRKSQHDVAEDGEKRVDSLDLFAARSGSSGGFRISRQRGGDTVTQFGV